MQPRTAISEDAELRGARLLLKRVGNHRRLLLCLEGLEQFLII